MKILGIDLGLKRTGLAVSDDSGQIVRRLDNLQANNQKEALSAIYKICTDLKVKIVVIGLPQESPTNKALCQRINSFSLALEKLFMDNSLEIKIFLFDESYTSKIALKNLVYNNIAKKKRKKHLDAEAACVLIEEFFYWYQENFRDYE